MMNDLRSLPSVDQILQMEATSRLIDSYGRALTVEGIRAILDEIRQEYKKNGCLPASLDIHDRVRPLLEDWLAPSLVSVINASGVILHTNLGRAPLSNSAIQAMQEMVMGYSNLEFNLKTGKRGTRLVHAEQLLTRLVGTEAAVVVNNNAGAVLLALSALAKRRRVVISRSQLVEIGGGFRVPDVMKQSGAKLVEVGTTNRVHLYDYEIALQDPTALVMRAHSSNFRIVGFTSEPPLGEIVELAKNYDVPFLDDLGSGALLDTTKYGLAHEPTVQDSIKAGVDLICFSGDKLLGGPQAGILVGRKKLIDKVKKHPLARALRADKLCLAALSATLRHYLKGEAEQEIPIWRMIASTEKELLQRANRWAERLGFGDTIDGFSTIGGGSLPTETLPTKLLAISVRSPERVMKALRSNDVPIIARIENERILFDPRTVFPEQEEVLLATIKKRMESELIEN